MRLGRLRSTKGFTLVELMTVVAIIGALAALGVPQYKKMQRKAKRAEANMVLGVIGSAEAAFYAEYNGYGNSMGGIGAEMDNDPQYYYVGFFNAANSITTLTQPSFWEFGSSVAAVPNAFPGYSAAAIRAPGCAATNANSASVLTIIGACFTPAGARSTAVPQPTATGAACTQQGTVGYDTTTPARPVFTAVAKGNLYQNATAAQREDCVTMSHMREIRVIQDGT